MTSTIAPRMPMLFGRPAAFILLATTIVVAFLFGGGARDDIRSLLLLRPISALMFVAAMAYALPAAWRDHRMVLSLAAAWTGLILVHLAPLPPWLWTSLPGRDGIVKIYAGLDMPLPWLPLSIAPDVTWNAAFALLLPLAALVFALSLPRERMFIVLRLILVIGFVSGIVGLLQAINPDRSALYFYRITNERNAVGLFANRNHQALLLACMFPMLSAHLSLLTGRAEKLLLYKRLTIAGVALLIPLILVTGSRAGLIAAVVAMPAALLIYRAPVPTGRVVKGQRAGPVQTLIAVGSVAILAIVTLATSRATAVQRLLGEDIGSDLRAKVAPILLGESWRYFPFGSGIGTFVETYALVEPDALLSPNYVNHAHNDFLELLLTGGAPAIALLLCGAVMIAVAAKRILLPADRADAATPSATLGKLGLALLVLLAIGSAADYPLRTPSLAVLAMFAIACVCVGVRQLALPDLSGHRRDERMADAVPAAMNRR